MTIKRAKKRMKNADIKRKAYKHGYKFTGYSKWKCDACEEEMWEAIQTIGYTGTTPPWADAHCALKFHGKESIIVACSCGWRKDVTVRSTKQCETEGCNAILPVGRKHFCYRCKPTPDGAPKKQALNDSKSIICNRKGCDNPVPSGRKAVCYSCQPPAKESMI